LSTRSDQELNGPPPTWDRPSVWSGRDRLLSAAIVLVAIAPALVAAVTVLGSDWVPADDQAIEVMRISDVGGGRTPLLGAWSRWHWNHPGPLLFWIAAPLYHLIGNVGVLLTCTLLAAASSAGVVLVALRRGGHTLGALSALLVVVLTGAFGLGTLADPWNPFVALIPFLLFLFLVWAVLCDDLVLLPVAAAVGSFCMQAHVGYIPLVVGIGAFTLAGVAVRYVRRATSQRSATVVPIDDRPGDDADELEVGRSENGADAPTGTRHRVVAAMRRHRLASSVGATMVLLLLLWAPALADQVAGSGNLSAILEFSTNPTEVVGGWRNAIGIMSTQLGIPAPWMDAHDSLLIALPRTSSAVIGALGLLVIVTVSALAFIRRRSDAGLLGLVALAAVAMGVVSTARMSGVAYPYLLRWWWCIGAIAFLAVVWGLISITGIERNRWIAVVAVVAAAVFGIGVSVRDAPVHGPNPTSSTALSHLIGTTAAATRPDGRYVIRTIDELNLGGVGRGLALGLEQDGRSVFVEPDDLSGYQVGTWRTLRADESDGVITIVGLDSIDSGWVPPSDAQRIAVSDPLSPAERREFAELQRKIRPYLGKLIGEGVVPINSPYLAERAVQAGASRADVDRMVDLQLRGSGFAVYLQPPPLA